MRNSRELSLSVGGERSLNPVWEERITFSKILAKSSDANVYLRSRDIAPFFRPLVASLQGKVCARGRVPRNFAVSKKGELEESSSDSFCC